MKREPHAFKLMPEEPNPADDNLPCQHFMRTTRFRPESIHHRNTQNCKQVCQKELTLEISTADRSLKTVQEESVKPTCVIYMR
jgi:hypothetical protein